MSSNKSGTSVKLDLNALLANAYALGVAAGSKSSAPSAAASKSSAPSAAASNSSSSSSSSAAASRFSFDREAHERDREAIGVNGKGILADWIPDGRLLDAVIRALQNRAQSAQAAEGRFGVIDLSGSLGPIFDLLKKIDLCNTRIDADASMVGNDKLNAIVGFQRIKALFIALRQLNDSFTKPLRAKQIATIDSLLNKLAKVYKTKEPALHTFIVKVNADLKAIPLTSLSKDL